MPRPPILPLVDWKAVFFGGLEYDRWITTGEFPDHRSRMEEARRAQPIDEPTAARLRTLERSVYVVAFAEDWCGDVVRHVPVLEALANRSPHLRVRYVARTDHPQVFARFLTNGGEAIPKFVFLSENFVECGNWGPMPEACRKWIARGKAMGDTGSARKKVSALYEADPGKTAVCAELMDLIDIAVTTRL